MPSLLIHSVFVTCIKVCSSYHPSSKGGVDNGKSHFTQSGALEDPMLCFGVVNLSNNFDFNEEDMTMKEISLSQKFPFPGKLEGTYIESP